MRLVVTQILCSGISKCPFSCYHSVDRNLVFNAWKWKCKSWIFPRMEEAQCRYLFFRWLAGKLSPMESVNGPCVTEHNSGYFIWIYLDLNAKMTPAHAFEVIKMYPVSLQEKQLLLGTAVGICIKKPSGGYLNLFLIPQWSHCGVAAVCVGIQHLASQEPPWHPQVLPTPTSMGRTRDPSAFQPSAGRTHSSRV